MDIYGRPINTEGVDGETGPDVHEFVVKVFSVHSSQDPQAPWSNKPQEEISGSGCVILHEGKECIITNAHVVADATYVEVRKAGDAMKYPALRVKTSHECDLALLRVEDATFWENVSPMDFGNMPSLQDEVAVLGFPEGGEGISVTSGVVSRIEIQTYEHSGHALLAVQIDAAINLGNSGGPVLSEESLLIGIAFQNQSNSQNIGYVIPVPIIKHFLADTDPQDRTRCRGWCGLGILWQDLENQQLRAFLGLEAKQSGVYVRGLMPLAPAEGFLRSADVILEMDGQKISNNGSFQVGSQERLSFQHLVNLKFPGDEVEMRVVREGREICLSVPAHPIPCLVPREVHDRLQSWFLYGGMLFLPLTSPYLQEWGEHWREDAPVELANLVSEGFRSVPEEEVVVLSKCFPSKRTAGYGYLNDRRVLKVCGQRVVNLQQMYSLIQELHPQRKFLEFSLQALGADAYCAVDTDIAESITEDVMRVYRIPSMASADLLALRSTSASKGHAGTEELAH